MKRVNARAPVHDPLSVAHCILENARRPITSEELQATMYFVQAQYLYQTNGERPLFGSLGGRSVLRLYKQGNESELIASEQGPVVLSVQDYYRQFKGPIPQCFLKDDVLKGVYEEVLGDELWAVNGILDITMKNGADAVCRTPLRQRPFLDALGAPDKMITDESLYSYFSRK